LLIKNRKAGEGEKVSHILVSVLGPDQSYLNLLGSGQYTPSLYLDFSWK